MTRSFLLFVLAVMAFAGLLVAALATTQARDYNLRGYVNATENTNLPYRQPRLGVNADLRQYDEDKLMTQLDQMDQAGVTWVRQFVDWRQIEPEQGTYKWQHWDHIVNAVAEYPRQKLVVVLVGSPSWALDSAQAEADFDYIAPDDLNAFASFAGAFAARYGDTIDHYQVWDEPNIRTAWGNRDPRAAQYAAMLQASYDSIHANDASAQVIAAALAPTTERGPRNISDIMYLEQLYTYGVGGFADAFAGKPYGFESPPSDRRVANDVLNFSRIVALREVLVAHGDGDKRLWASNWGWNSLPSDWEGKASISGNVDAATQQAYTLEGWRRAEREWPWLGGMILQHWQPDQPPDNPVWGFSVLDPQGNPSELYSTLQTMGTSGPDDAATNGIYPARNPYATYNGVWTFGDLGADIGWVQDSGFSFRFAGNAVALLVNEADYVAHFYATINGEPADSLPQDSAGNAYLLLRSDTLQPSQSLVTLGTDLGDGVHELQVKADELVPDEAAHRWPLMAFAVSSEGDLATPYNRQITVAWVGTVLAFLSVVVTASRINWRPIRTRTAGIWNTVGSAMQLALSLITALSLMIGMLLTWGDGVPTLFKREPVQLGLAVLTAGIIYINTSSILLTILAGLTLFIIVYHRLELGLILTLLFAPFFLFPVELYEFAFPMAEITLLITAAAWLLRGLNQLGQVRQTVPQRYATTALRDLKQQLTLIDFSLIAWVLAGVLAYTCSARSGIAVTELRTLFIEPALFYLVARTITIDRPTLFRFVDALIAAGVVVSVIGLIMWFRGEGVIEAEGGVERLASVYGSPNNVGLFLGRVIPFALAATLLPLGMQRRVWAGFALIVMTVAVLLAQSAGALFVGLPAGIVVVLLLIFKRRAIPLLVFLLVIGVIGVLVASQSPRFERLLDLSQGTNFYRLRVWESSLNMLGDYPLTGVGLDQFLYEFRGEYIMPDAWEDPELSHPHNIVLDFWLRLGLPGVFVLGLFIFAYWRASQRVYERLQRKRPPYFVLLVGALGSMAALFAHGMIDNSIYVLDLMYTFMLLMLIPTLMQNVSAIDDTS